MLCLGNFRIRVYTHFHPPDDVKFGKLSIRENFRGLEKFPALDLGVVSGFASTPSPPPTVMPSHPGIPWCIKFEGNMTISKSGFDQTKNHVRIPSPCKSGFGQIEYDVRIPSPCKSGFGQIEYDVQIPSPFKSGFGQTKNDVRIPSPCKSGFGQIKTDVRILSPF